VILAGGWLGRIVNCPKDEEAAMFRNIGWAAFLASVISLVAFGSGPTSANGGRPIYGCFSPDNAMVIGRLGADDPSVRYGFETGECLALPAGVPVNDVERRGALWRFRVLGAKPYLYAADWAAGFTPATTPVPPGFERYLPVTANLLGVGRTYAQCYDETERLNARFEDLQRRWRAYWARSNPQPAESTPVVRIFVGDEGPKLMREDQELRRQAAALERRCNAVSSIEVDDDFVAFARSAARA
jgi:hypothetical protein